MYNLVAIFFHPFSLPGRLLSPTGNHSDKTTRHMSVVRFSYWQGEAESTGGTRWGLAKFFLGRLSGYPLYSSPPARRALAAAGCRSYPGRAVYRYAARLRFILKSLWQQAGEKKKHKL
jgi:hypothetical protein